VTVVDKVVDTVPRRPLLFLGTTLVCSLPCYALNRLDVPVPFGLPPSVAMIIVPAAVAGTFVARDEGRRGVRRWLASLVDVRRTPPRTLLTAALLMPAVHLVAAGLSGAVTPVTPSAAALTLVVFILGAIPEELGWTAYATGPMQERFGVTGAGMVIGAVWAGWHVVPWLSMGHSWRWVAWQSAVTVAMRVIMGHLFRMSGRSAATALLFHAVSNASLEILPGAVEPRRTAIVATLLILLAAGVTKVNRST